MEKIKMKEISKSIYKIVSAPIVKFFVHYRFSANEVTMYSMIFMAAGGYAFAMRLYWGALVFCGISAVLDYADGDVAKATTGYTPAGAWIDAFGDIIKQNGIMGCIAIGINAPAWLIVTFFVANAALNVISLHYNNTFGFDSYNGNELFRKYMNMKPTILNRFLKNIIDPTSSWIGLWLGTVRYWIILGVIFSCMPLVFVIITCINVFKALFMFTIYALHLAEYKKLWLLQALAILDKERKEYYQIRSK
jgi:phosphatidylglycerophosphate synthase